MADYKKAKLLGEKYALIDSAAPEDFEEELEEIPSRTYTSYTYPMFGAQESTSVVTKSIKFRAANVFNGSKWTSMSVPLWVPIYSPRSTPVESIRIYIDPITNWPEVYKPVRLYGWRPVTNFEYAPRIEIGFYKPEIDGLPLVKSRYQVRRNEADIYSYSTEDAYQLELDEEETPPSGHPIFGNSYFEENKIWPVPATELGALTPVTTAVNIKFDDDSQPKLGVGITWLRINVAVPSWNADNGQPNAVTANIRVGQFKFPTYIGRKRSENILYQWRDNNSLESTWVKNDDYDQLGGSNTMGDFSMSITKNNATPDILIGVPYNSRGESLDRFGVRLEDEATEDMFNIDPEGTIDG